jgi:hypothetical protein
VLLQLRGQHRSGGSNFRFALEELKKSLLPGSFQRIADLSVSSRRKLHRAQPLVQQLVFFEKRVTQSFAFR